MAELQGPSKKPIQGVEMHGTFNCHLCDEQADTAFYIPSEESLSWTCPNGHDSNIEVNLYG